MENHDPRAVRVPVWLPDPHRAVRARATPSPAAAASTIVAGIALWTMTSLTIPYRCRTRAEVSQTPPRDSRGRPRLASAQRDSLRPATKSPKDS